MILDDFGIPKVALRFPAMPAMPFHPSPAPRLRMMLPYAAGFFSLAKVKGLGGRRHGWSVELGNSPRIF